jgi:hypothetical protein
MPLSPRHGGWRRAALWSALGLVVAGVGTLKWPLPEWRKGRQDVAPDPGLNEIDRTRLLARKMHP